MKLLIATAVLVTLAASPALSQNYRYGPYARGPGSAYAYAPQPYATYGAVPGAFGPYGRTLRTWDSVYSPQGWYVGSDPDSRVRDQLARDPAQGD